MVLRVLPVCFSLLQLTELLSLITWKNGVAIGHICKLRLDDFILFLDANYRVAKSGLLKRGLLGSSSI